MPEARLDADGNPIGRSGKPWYRAGGDMVCDTCGRNYFQHPEAKEYPAWYGGAWLHRLCNGDLVHL
jgi:hypothetical protein